MEQAANVQTQASLIAQFSVLDYAIVVSLIGITTYWLLSKKKTQNDFDASSIKTFALVYVFFYCCFHLYMYCMINLFFRFFCSILDHHFKDHKVNRDLLPK